MAIKTSANVPMKGGKTGNYDRAGQSTVKSGSGIKTTAGTYGAKGKDSFYGGKLGKRNIIKTTGGC